MLSKISKLFTRKSNVHSDPEYTMDKKNEPVPVKRFQDEETLKHYNEHVSEYEDSTDSFDICFQYIRRMNIEDVFKESYLEMLDTVIIENGFDYIDRLLLHKILGWIKEIERVVNKEDDDEKRKLLLDLLIILDKCDDQLSVGKFVDVVNEFMEKQPCVKYSEFMEALDYLIKHKICKANNLEVIDTYLKETIEFKNSILDTTEGVADGVLLGNHVLIICKRIHKIVEYTPVMDGQMISIERYRKKPGFYVFTYYSNKKKCALIVNKKLFKHLLSTWLRVIQIKFNVLTASIQDTLDAVNTRALRILVKRTPAKYLKEHYYSKYIQYTYFRDFEKELIKEDSLELLMMLMGYPLHSMYGYHHSMDESRNYFEYYENQWHLIEDYSSQKVLPVINEYAMELSSYSSKPYTQAILAYMDAINERFSKEFEEKYGIFTAGGNVEWSLEEWIEYYCNELGVFDNNSSVRENFVFYLMDKGLYMVPYKYSYVISEKITTEKILDLQEKNEELNGKSSVEGFLSIEDVDALDGFVFEHVVQKLMTAMGYIAEVTKATGDQGLDVLARKNGISYGVQAKRYSDKVNNKAVQEVVGAMKHYGCDAAIVVTNNYFTKSAKELAESNSVILWDRDMIKTLLTKYNVIL